MKLFRFVFAAGLVAQFGCIPPVGLLGPAFPEQPKPLHGMPENDPTAVDRLAGESTRLWPRQSQDPFPKIVDALLQMGYVITVSDSTARVISFERSQKEPKPLEAHAGLGYDSAITLGTIRLSQETQGVRCTLVLAGKINWRTRERATRVELIPRLSPDEHKRFLDELSSKM